VSSLVKVNGEPEEDFRLSRSVRQGCPLTPYLFIITTYVLGLMLDDPKHEIKRLHLPKGGCVRDQTFANDIACRNPSFGLATKVRGCKVAGQEGDPGVTSHAPGSAKSVRE
jgi:hypothetical protein